METRFEQLEHTADKGIRAYGDNLPELFQNAATGMFSLMADIRDHAPTQIREIEAEAPDLPQVLRAWLGELLFLFEVEHVLFVEFKVLSVEETRMKGIALGIPFSSAVERLGSAVKAVTYHDLDVHQTDKGWQATVIFDV